MRIWQATEHDYQMRFYWFATKKEALAHKRAYNPPPHWESGSCEVESIDVSTTRAGIVKAMNWIMDMTCYNDG